MGRLSGLFNSIQTWLLPAMEEELGELGEKEREFVRLIELAEPDRFLEPFCWHGKGRPPESRLSLFKAFSAKAVFNYPDTKALIGGLKGSPKLRRLCGWEALG